MSYEIVSVRVRMPAGTYVVGDPCYTVPDHRWMEWLAASDPDVFGEGATSQNCKRILVAELDGKPVLGIGTAHGDGMYQDESGNRYPVDAGLIGLVPIEIAEGRREDLGNVVTFDRPFDCEYDEGVIRLGNIAINTEDDDDDSGSLWGGEEDDE